MRFKQAIEEWKGLRYVSENLELLSGMSRRHLNNCMLCTQKEVLEKEYDVLDFWTSQFTNSGKKSAISELLHLLSEVLDITGTIKNIEDGVILGDVELYEVKHLAMVSSQIRLVLMSEFEWTIPDLKGVVSLLDPDDLQLSSFYIYDSYDEGLRGLRRQLISIRDGEENALYGLIDEVENRVRQDLTEKLKFYINSIKEVLVELSDLDIRLAKSKQIIEYNLCRPEFNSNRISYEGLFHIEITEELAKEGKVFQRIDVEMGERPILLSGMNMGGKTVLLNSIGVSQLMAQYGFFVPANKADVSIVEGVLCSMHERVESQNGLSSFAAEMMVVNGILNRIKSGGSYLVLVDELARTTNPTEGRAIVSAFLDMLSESENRGIVTSHYDNVQSTCKRMRVRGLRDMNIEAIDKLNNNIDYSLIEDECKDSPKEALRIAELLGVDEELISRSREKL